MIEIDVFAEWIMALKVKEKTLASLFTQDTSALDQFSGKGENTAVWQDK